MSESRRTARSLRNKLPRAYSTSFPFVPLYAVLIILVGWSCNAIDRDEPIPSYLHITEFELSVPGDNSQGSSAADIRDVWLDVNGQAVGVFEVPVTVPVLDNTGLARHNHPFHMYSKKTSAISGLNNLLATVFETRL